MLPQIQLGQQITSRTESTSIHFKHFQIICFSLWSRQIRSTRLLGNHWDSDAWCLQFLTGKYWSLTHSYVHPSLCCFRLITYHYFLCSLTRKFWFLDFPCTFCTLLSLLSLLLQSPSSWHSLLSRSFFHHSLLFLPATGMVDTLSLGLS